jgi:membrane protease YdiL (CAAX protease family)
MRRSSGDDAVSPTAAAAAAPATLTGAARRLMIWEIIAVFSVSLGINTLHAVVSFVGSVTERQALSDQHAVLNFSQAPGRPWLDLSLQLVSIASGLGPVVLVFYLLARNGEGPSAIGVDTTQPWRDLARGAGIAAVIGGCGLFLYYLAFRAGIALNIVAAQLPAVWWRIPVLLFSALQDGLLEEILVVGYLLSRLRLIGLSWSSAIAIGAVFRGSYHLTQGFGAFLGNVIMGVIFGVLFMRWGRTNPMIIAHFLINAVAFIGYTYLAAHVSWLP